MTTTLLPREWLAVCLLVLGITSFAFLAYQSHPQEFPNTHFDPHYLVSQDIVVSIQGAVSKPGLYTIKKGTSVEEALSLAEPTPEANLEKLKLKNKVRNGQKIKVPSKKGPKGLKGP